MRCVVGVQLGEAVVVIQDLRTEVALQKGLDETDILVISDSATIVSFCYQIVQRLVRCLWLLIQIHLELRFGCNKVRVHPLIWDVPTYGTILSPLQDDCMEVCQRKEQLLVLPRLVAALIVLLGHLVERAFKIGLEPFWRLIGELDSILEHRHGEVLARH